MKIVFLGTSSGAPTLTRNVTAIALVLDSGRMWLFDCGEGTQIQMLKASLPFQKIDRIFITHLHGDHFYGLPGLLAMRSMKKAKDPLEVFGPQGIREVLQTIANSNQSYYSYPLTITELTQSTSFSCLENIAVSAFPIIHRVPCWGYILKENERPGKFSTEKALAKGVPKGKLLGQLARGNEATLPDGTVIKATDCLFDPTPGRHLAILGDTSDPSALAEAAKGCHVLVHETTFEAKETELAILSGHSTTQMAAKFAEGVEAKTMAITHFSARYETTDKLLQEAQEACPNTKVFAAYDFMSLQIDENCQVTCTKHATVT